MIQPLPRSGHDPRLVPATSRATTPPPLDVAVLGAGGDAGRAVTSALLARGHDVTAVVRSVPDRRLPGIAQRPADLLDRDALVAATADADVIVTTAQPGYAKWASQLPTMVEHTIAAAAAAGARLVMVDNLYMYAPVGGPISTNLPAHASDPLGSVRGQVADTILVAQRAGRIRATIGRQSDFYGPGAVNSLLWMLAAKPGLAGRTMRAYLADDQPHTFAWLPDTARAVAALVEDDGFDGRGWVLPAAPAITQRAMLDLVNRHLPEPVRIGRLSYPMLRLAGLVNADLRMARHTRGQFERPWVTDASDFLVHRPEFTVTPHDVAVPAWLADRPGHNVVRTPPSTGNTTAVT